MVLLRCGLTYPLPEKKIRKLLEAPSMVLVVEEGDPAVEDQVRSLAAGLPRVPVIRGKRGDNVLPPWGELNPDLVEGALRRVLAMPPASPTCSAEAADAAQARVAARSSALCAGCSHLGSYWALKQVLRSIPGNHIVNGDIGCYEQGGYGVSSRKVTPSQIDSCSPFPLILVGQSELRRTLRLTKYEAIAQRIPLQYHLGGLSPEETAA